MIHFRGAQRVKLLFPLYTELQYFLQFSYISSRRILYTYTTDGCIIRKYVFIIRSHCQPMMLLIIISSDTIKQLAGKRSRPIRMYIIIKEMLEGINHILHGCDIFYKTLSCTVLCIL